jgi:hypothetical protein
MKIAGLARCLVILASSTLLAQVPIVYPSLQPPSAKPERGGFVLEIGGTGFSRRAVVEWNGSTRTTEFISRSVLKANINAADVAHAGAASVRVVNPGGKASNVVFFPVRNRSSAVTFAQKLVFPGCGGVVAGDFNNDGILDVAWGNSTSLFVSLGDAKGDFRRPSPAMDTPLTRCLQLISMGMGILIWWSMTGTTTTQKFTSGMVMVT